MPDKPAFGHDDDEVPGLLRLAGRREPPPAARGERVRVQARAAWQQAVRRHRERRLKTWAGLAMAAAAAGVLIALYAVPRPVAPAAPHVLASVEHVNGDARVEAPLANGAIGQLQVGAAVVSGAIVRTGANGFVTLRLPDGDAVRLDSNSHLQLLGATQLGLERGGVYIDAGSAAIQLEVLTPFGTARDIGTRFEVRLLASGVRVRVREGRVQLDGGGPPAEATAGWELTRSSGGEIERRTIALTGAEWDWVTRAAAPFEIEGRSLADFLRWIESEGGWRVAFADPALERSAGGIILHGSIRGLTPAEALGVVLPTCGLSHRFAGDRVIVEAAPGAGGRR
jgi:ferric-dicitrate binding protein FerR (iron transport regulator)